MKIKGLIIIVVAIALFLAFNSAYIIDETEQVVITRFGKLIGKPKTTPGIKFKVPFLDTANFFPKNLLTWDGDPGQIPTIEKTFIWVDTFARWKIVDPVKFFESVNNLVSAKGRLDEIIDPAVRNLITSNKLIEAVRKTNRKLDTFELGMDKSDKDRLALHTIKIGREKITQEILDQARPKLVAFGVELVDVKIKRINYVEAVQKTVYDRMIAERQQIAEKYRSEGKGEASKIEGDKDRDLKQISSEAYKTAQEIKGKADAEATKLYARAYGRDPSFYSFIKTLEIYSVTLDKNSSLVLSTDSEFLKYLKSYK
ncbi:MAG: protease modulator HflC [Deltaproteobacteria bacterium]|nr:protease modulator HflC [Deltaproteobacteria bacterium]MBW2364022.1 protease modulator HflC [Deltaproteobacteria bacterium]